MPDTSDKTIKAGPPANIPLYRSTECVQALKIREIEFHDDGSATITPDEDGFEPFRTSKRYKAEFQWPRTHDRDDPGYFVMYYPDDPDYSYHNWLSTPAFERAFDVHSTETFTIDVPAPYDREPIGAHAVRALHSFARQLEEYVNRRLKKSDPR